MNTRDLKELKHTIQHLQKIHKDAKKVNDFKMQLCVKDVFFNKENDVYNYGLTKKEQNELIKNQKKRYKEIDKSLFSNIKQKLKKLLQ